MSEDAITDRIKEVIRNYEAAILRKLNAANEAGKDEIRDYVETFIRNLSIEFPIAIKDILDQGGAVRQVISKSSMGTLPQERWITVYGTQDSRPQAAEDNSWFSSYDLDFKEIARGVICRVTIIVEPILEKGE